MSLVEMDDLSTVVRIDEAENHWAKEFDQLETQPADELADPGPRGKRDLTPAISADGALITSIGVAQGAGEVAQGDSAQGVGDVAQGGSTRSDNGDYDGVFSVTGSVDKYEGAYFVIDSDGTDVASEDYGYHAFDSVSKSASDPE